MSELLAHFHFLRPLWLLALVPAVLVGWLVWRQQDPRRGYGAIIAPHLLAHLVIRAGKTSLLRPEIVLLCVLPLSILALAGPSWRQEPSPFAEDQADAIVFTQGKNPDQREGEQDTSTAGAMSDAELRHLWLRRVQTAPADFLRAKFAYQAATQGSKP
jgi:hypothetical protein